MLLNCCKQTCNYFTLIVELCVYLCWDMWAGYWDEGVEPSPPVPPKTYLQQTTSDDYNPTENISLDYGETDSDPQSHPAHPGLVVNFSPFNSDVFSQLIRNIAYLFST